MRNYLIKISYFQNHLVILKIVHGIDFGCNFGQFLKSIRDEHDLKLLNLF